MADTAARLRRSSARRSRPSPAASTREELEELRVRYLGRKSELTTTLRSIGELPPEERGRSARRANAVRQALEALIGEPDPGARGRRARARGSRRTGST